MTGRDDVPPARQCTLPSCHREAIDTDRDGQLSERHLKKLDEGVNSADESPSENPSEALDNETDTQEGDGVTAREKGANAGTSDDKTPNRGGCGTPHAHAADEPAYPDAITRREWWVAWILDGVERKRPVAPWQTGHAYPVEWRADLDGDERPEVDFETAKRWVDFPLADLGLALPDDALSDTLRLGIILPVDRPPRDERIVLIDWDDVRDPATDEIHPVAAEFIDKHGGYVEVSRSGEGLHQFVFGGLRHRDKFIAPIDTDAFVGDDLPQVEIYDGGRHVAMTGEHVDGTDADVVDGQDCIDDIVSEFAGAELDAGHRTYDPATGATPTDDETSDASGVDSPVPEPEPCDYQGPPIEELREQCPPDRSLAYHAVVEAFCDGYAGVLNWRLEGAAAALGQREDRTVEEVVDDLRGAGRDGGSAGYDKKTPGRVTYDHKRAARGEYAPASYETLASWGVLPSEFADRMADDDTTANSVDAVAPIAFERLDVLAAPERKRYARKRGLDIPSTSDARDRLRDAIFREFRSENRTVLDAPTALGKSHTVATIPWLSYPDVTGNAPVVHLHATREARDDAAGKTNAASRSTGRVLKGRTECCPVAAGDHDPEPDAPPDEQPDPVVTIDGTAAKEWFDHLCDEKGLPFSTAHAIARERNDQGLEALPCCEEEGADCRAITQWDGIPRDTDGDPAVDVIHATHQFAYVPSLRSHTNVVLDERPDYTETFTDAGTPETETGRVRRMVTAYLREIGAPVATWEAFVSLARLEFDGHTSDAIQERDALDDAIGTEPSQEWYVTDPDAHALAPDLTKAIWQALRWESPDENNRRSTKVFHEPPRLDTSDGDSYGGTWLAVVIDEENTIQTVRTTPDFSQARSVVGLDAHPSMPMWQLNAGPEMDGSARDAVLDPHERRLWRRYERGLTVAQIGDATRPRSGPSAREWMNDDRVRAIIDQLREHYGDDFATAITTQQVEDAVATLLDNADVNDPETMHYGEEKSRNDFADEPAGYVYGCMDAGDDMILNAIAELGLDAQASRVDPNDVDDPGNSHCGTCSGDGCHSCNDTGRKREKGRTFDGPDADTAHAVLESVRESHVAQAAGRYARNPDDPESAAVVYVHTDAAPAGFVDLRVPGVEWLATPLQREIVDALTRRPSATTRKLADDVDCSKEHVRETLSRLETHELVERRSGAGDHGADVYHDTDATDALVDLGETTNEPLPGYSRWSLAIHDRDASSSGDTGDRAAGESVATDGGVSTGGDPPPR